MRSFKEFIPTIRGRSPGNVTAKGNESCERGSEETPSVTVECVRKRNFNGKVTVGKVGDWDDIKGGSVHCRRY